MLTDFLVDAIRPLSFRGKLRLLNTLIPHEGERTFEAHGCRFCLDLSELAERNVYFGTYETEEAALARQILGPGDSFVDANGGIGFFTALAASRVGPTGQILAVEARTMSYLRLERVVRDNHLNQVVLHHGALGAREQAPVTTLDTLAARHRLAHIDLLKIEGCDLSLLAGAARLLAQRRIGAVLCRLDSPDTRMLAQLDVLGFRHARSAGASHFFTAAPH